MFSNRSSGVCRGDEALDALDVPGAVVLLDCLGASGTDVGAGVGLGEDHGGAPSAFDDGGCPLLLLFGAVVEQHVREGGSGLVHVCCRLCAQDQLTDGPHDGAGTGTPSDLFAQSHAVPLASHRALNDFFKGFRKCNGVRLGIEDRGLVVRIGERFAKRSLGQACDLCQHVADSSSQVAPSAFAQWLLQSENLEEVELQVPNVALVMAHVFCFSQ